MIPSGSATDDQLSDQSPMPVSYRKKFTRSYCGWLGLRLIPYFCLHLVRRPYFRDIPEIGYNFPRDRKNRYVRNALYGAMYNILLEGYQDLTGTLVRAETGQFLFLVIDMTKVLDEYLDNQIDLQHVPQVQESLDTPSVRIKIEFLRRYVEMHKCENPVFEYLNGLFQDHYDNYVEALARARGTNNFEAALEAAQIDTGTWLGALMDLVAIFNESVLEPEAQDQFYWLGMVGKFADDMVDLTRDIEQARLNLIHMLLEQQIDELHRVQSAISRNVRLNAKWWNEQCPRTFNSYFEIIDSYYRHINNEQLKLACDLIVLPTLLGRDYDHARSL